MTRIESWSFWDKILVVFAVGCILLGVILLITG